MGNENNNRKATLMQLEVSLPKKVIFSIVIMVALILIVFFFNIPNPNMILITGLVLCSAMFGYGGGIIAAVIMLFYTLFFFSTDHSFTQFDDQNLQKVVVSLIGIAADMLLVCSLKRAEVQAFKEIDDLTEKLKQENEHLQNVSLTDALTGIRNRLALRQDYDTFFDHEVTVMMVDLDKFKHINDTYGHEEGDKILKQTAKTISSVFGREHCYRFGGDEFLVIYPDISEEDFEKKVNEMLGKRPELIVDGVRSEVDFSIGFVHEKIDDHNKLRKMFSAADERMYQNKRVKGSDLR